MAQDAKTGHELPRFETIPRASKALGISAKRLRRMAAEGAFPVYDAGSAWPRVDLDEVAAWVKSTRVRPSSHAAQRVAEVLEREAAP